ncbi:MAG TPA: SusC/RagA family TonB-linked outer membrane protein, partial [Chryseosolibacter sp.]
SGKLPYFTAEEINAMGEGTDWIDQMTYKNAVTQSYNLGVSGGSDVSVYSVALAYTSQDGIVGGPDVSHYDRYNFRLNSEHKLLNEKITLGENLTFAYTGSRGVATGNQYSNSLRGAFEVSPFLPMYDDNGEYLNNAPGAGAVYKGAVWVPWSPDEANPYAQMMLNNQNRNNGQKLFGNAYAVIEPVKHLTFRSTFGADFTAGEGRSYSPIYELSIYAVRTHDQASQSLSKGLAWQWDNVLTYDRAIGDHAFTLMAGTFAYSSTGTWMNISNADLIRPSLNYAWIAGTTNTDLARLSYGGGPYDESKLQSYFGRISYNYKEKYLINASYRADGSSRFEKSHRWGYFPSVSAGWVLSNEPFFTAQNAVDFLKIRGSFGQVGNQSIPAFQYLAPISMSNGTYYFGSADFDASGNSVGAYPSRLPNPAIKWETSEQKNLGFDASFLDTRLGMELEVYNKTTKDWLIQAPVLATAGAEAPFINGGNVKNTGVELSLRWKDEVNGLKYAISMVGSRNRNEVTDVPTPDGFIGGDGNGLYNNAPAFYRRAQTGFPIGYFWGWKTNGIFQNEAEVAAYTNPEGTLIQPNAKPGDLRYVDQDDNGVINEADKVMIGDPNPEYIFGFSVNAGYKGFDLNISAHGVMGNSIAQSYRNYARAIGNYTTEILGRWHGEGTSNTIPRVTETNINYLPSDIFIKDGDFLRIDNITLGYDLGKVLNPKVFKQARVFVSVLNAFTFTKYNGMDPEVGFGLQSGSSGTDLGYYPRARTAMAGLNFKF